VIFGGQIMTYKTNENHFYFFWIKINDMDKENLLPVSMRKIVEGVYKNDDPVTEQRGITPSP
jgi:hypothetical protein